MKKALIALLFGLLTIPALADNTIVENLQELIETRDAITNAIVQKGGTVTSGALTNVPNEILSIPSGGGDNSKFVSLVERTISGAITAEDLQGATTIGRDGFSRCPITSIELPNTVTSIGQSAFYQSTTLTSITIPNSVTNIGQGAFNGCTGLTTIDFGSTRSTIPTLSNVNAFNGLPANYQILVPEALLTDWKAANNWSSLASHIYPHLDFDATKTYVVNASGEIIVEQDIQGRFTDDIISGWRRNPGGLLEDGSETIVIGTNVQNITATPGEYIGPGIFHLAFLDREESDIYGWTNYAWDYYSGDQIKFLNSRTDHTIP